MGMHIEGFEIWSCAGDAGMHGICRLFREACCLCLTDGLISPTRTL